VRALLLKGYEITFANPKGNTPQLDVNSAIAQFFGGDEAKLQDYLKFRDSLTGLKNPTRISDVIASGLDQYDAVFVPGGHGPMSASGLREAWNAGHFSRLHGWNKRAGTEVPRLHGRNISA